MIKTKFHLGWTVKKGVVGPFEELFAGSAPGTPVILPHDGQVLEPRDPANPSGTQQGFYPAYSYTYQKTFFAPADWEGRKTLLELEGVQRKAMVYLNGELAATHNNGYTGFFADLTPHLRPGQENTLKVLALNQEQASRWYPGSGIYRDVWLWQGDPIRFLPEKQRITTESLEAGYAVLRLEGIVANGAAGSRKLLIEAAILGPEGTRAASARCCLAARAGEDARWHIRLTLDDPALWSVETPSLYRLVLTLRCGETILDTHEETFGVRTLQLDARQGLRINGRPVKLRGACIHHDNGLIGAATYYDAELFRLKKMKDAGFNALRSAHHPMSKAMLRACDTLGMLVMDEFSDMWQEPKNPGDWASDFASGWKQTLTELVDKDYNHPCVVLYSTGNEIPEIAQLTGAAMGREIVQELRRLDPTRYTTFGLNGLLALRDHIDLLMRQRREPSPEVEAAGSEGLNAVMGDTDWDPVGSMMTSPLFESCAEAAICSVDVVGYNYITARHASEAQRYPHHVVVGSETFPREIGTLWPIVQANAHVIGDFTWTGYDYLGEAGIGIPHYESTNGAQGVYPDRLAYCGDIDLNGTRRPVSYLRQIAFGLRKEPFLAVERVNRHGAAFDDNAWKYPDSIDSWTFPGWEGKPAVVRVLSDAEEVELLLNGRSLGRLPVGEKEPYTAIFSTVYQPGELTAVAFRGGAAAEQTRLRTAGAPAQLCLTADRQTLPGDAQSLAFLTGELTDGSGTPNPWATARVSVEVEGPGTLLGFGSACPSCEGSYRDHTWQTYDGKVMAVIRADGPGQIRVTFRAEGLPEASVLLTAT